MYVISQVSKAGRARKAPLQDGDAGIVLFLRLCLMGIVILLGAVHANNIFPSTVNLLLSQISIATMAIFVMYLEWTGRWKVVLPPEVLLTVAFTVWAATGFLIAQHRELYYDMYDTLVKTVALYVLLVNAVRSRRDLLWMMAGYVIVVSVMYAKSAEIIAEAESGGMRAAGIVGDANGLATWGTMGLVAIAFVLVASRSKLVKRLVLLSILPFMHMILSSGSRSGLMGIALLIILLYWLVLLPWLKRGTAIVRLVGKAAGLLAVATTFYVIINSAFWYRIEKLTGSGEYQSSLGSDTRTTLVKEGITLVKDYPLTGIGYLQSRATLGLVVHNTWVEAACSTGIPGLVFWLAAYIVLTVRVYRLRNNPLLSETERAALGVCLAFLFFWWFRSNFFNHNGDKVLLPMIAGITGYVASIQARLKITSDNHR